MTRLGVVSLKAPAFGGINLQDNPLQMDYAFALDANNCVLDKYGRVSSRKGYEVVVADTNPIAISKYIDSSAEEDLIYVTSTQIKSQTQGVLATGVFTDVTVILFNNQMFVYDKNSTYKITGAVGSLTATSITMPVNFTTALSTSGRVWGAKGDVVYWSDLLIGDSFTTGSAGFLNLSKVWANGEDEVVAIADHNNFLIIFGKNQVLIYQGFKEPETMTLADKIVGFGCVAKHSVQNIGSDVVFLSSTGVRSVMRVIQEKSAALGNYSLNIKKELTQRSQLDTAKSFYSPKDSIYGLCFNDKAYIFDTSGLLPNGSAKVTTWSGNILGSSYYVDRESNLYIGNKDGLCFYNGYADNGKQYKMTFSSGYLDLGDPNQLKFIKMIKSVFLSETTGNIVIKWAYNYSSVFNKETINIVGNTIAEYGGALYGVSTYGKGVVAQEKKININGSGNIVQIGVEAPINGGLVSIQRLDIYSTIGRFV
jgi:hypothetical protein